MVSIENQELDLNESVSEWRSDRSPLWYRDIGYRLQNVIETHRYDYKNKGVKPDDPGWHACTCGQWEGYWSGFEPHVADYLRAVALERRENAPFSN